MGEETIQTIDILVERAIRKKEIKDYFYQILKVIYWLLAINLLL